MWFVWNLIHCCFSDSWWNSKFCCICLCSSDSCNSLGSSEHYSQVWQEIVLFFRSYAADSASCKFFWKLLPCSAVLAHFILKEKLHIFGVVGCILCVVGSTTIVLHAPQEKAIESVKQVWHLATEPGNSTRMCMDVQSYQFDILKQLIKIIFAL